ncbi:RNA-binding protein [Trypanosoma theileri]|uniref:RNA-binding protein n=1 Tax=Trypanosoma theileri TaxID=67003 RepID=A0A1X0P6T4_9TRYP|nr:RNA-binding protein [Trypanosoma theileri]ORC92647.1 RNA-binding protein [Trypanosoma theileri]
MNYATVLGGPFSCNAPGNNNNNDQYSRLGYATDITGQHSQIMQHPSLNQAPGQALNVYPQFSQPTSMKDPRMNINIGSKLFVGQVPAMTTEEQLRPVFEPYGKLLEVKIMRDTVGRSKGSAWVRYETNEMAVNAINALHEKHTVPPQTNPLRVQFATPNSAKHQQQQQGKYPLGMRGPANPYNFGDPMSSSAKQPGIVMFPQGTSPSIISPIDPTSGAQYMTQPFPGSMDPAHMMTGPYTSNLSRFDNVNFPDNRREVYISPQPQTTATQVYQQQRIGFSPTPVSPNTIYNQQPSLPHASTRSNSDSKNGGGSGAYLGSFDAKHGVCDSNNNDIQTMGNDLPASLDPGVAIWEYRNNNDTQGQEQREPSTQVRTSERKNE